MSSPFDAEEARLLAQLAEVKKQRLEAEARRKREEQEKKEKEEAERKRQEEEKKAREAAAEEERLKVRAEDIFRSQSVGSGGEWPQGRRYVAIGMDLVSKASSSKRKREEDFPATPGASEERAAKGARKVTVGKPLPRGKCDR
jgi:hypothetical protein